MRGLKDNTMDPAFFPLQHCGINLFIAEATFVKQDCKNISKLNPFTLREAKTVLPKLIIFFLTKAFFGK